MADNNCTGLPESIRFIPEKGPFMYLTNRVFRVEY